MVGVGVTVPRSAGLTTSVKVFWTWPRALVAEMSTNVLPADVGVPEIVAVVGSKVRPSGSAFRG